MSLTDQAEAMKNRTSEYQEGVDAYRNGTLYEQNPYRGIGSSSELWEDGWCDAEAADVVEDYE